MRKVLCHERVHFGSNGTIVETSQLQCDAFNTEFAQHGLDLHCTKAKYKIKQIRTCDRLSWPICPDVGWQIHVTQCDGAGQYHVVLF